MAVEIAPETLMGTVSALPPVQLAVLGSLLFVVLAFVGRVTYRNLPSKRPPILEGVPYIGGLLKFAGVRVARRGRCLRCRTNASSRRPRRLASRPPRSRATL